MRATFLVKQILGLKGVVVSEVSVSEIEVAVNLKLTRAKLSCPKCKYSTRSCYDTKTVDSRWRHLDMGVRQTWLSCSLRRLKCPSHGVITESVPFARPVAESRFTRDFEHLVAWCTAKVDKTTVTKLTRIAWRTVGMICERVVAEELDPKRLENLFLVGVDEISYRKHHNYLTLVTNHDSGKIVYGSEGKSASSLDEFFAELGPDRARKIEAATMDMGPAFAKAFTEHAPGARLCLDPFHIVKLGTEALEEVRKDLWRQMRGLPSPQYARKFAGARWALLKNPGDLTERQGETLKGIKRSGGALWRAYEMKESLRAIFAGDLTNHEVTELIGRWCSRASRSRIQSFVRLSKTIRTHKDGIMASIELGISNGRVEGLNNKVRSIIARCYGLHSAQATLALVMLSCGPINLQLPYERRNSST